MPSYQPCSSRKRKEQVGKQERTACLSRTRASMTGKSLLLTMWYLFLIVSVMENHWEKRYDGPWLKSKVYSKEKTHVKLRRWRWKYGYRPMAIKTFFPRADDWAYRGKKDIQKIMGQKMVFSLPQIIYYLYKMYQNESM